ncbi:hypothetical protein ACFX15_012988 [Malus domestica]
MVRFKSSRVYVAERHWRIEAGSVQPLQGGAPVKPMAWAYVVVDAFRNERVITLELQFAGQLLEDCRREGVSEYKTIAKSVTDLIHITNL